jgi:1,4-alpha-glucan branching enzyme
MMPDLLRRKKKSFMLWRPGHSTEPPRLEIGRLVPGNPPAFAPLGSYAMQPVEGHPDLWQCEASRCGLTDGSVYHYWFAVQDTNPDAEERRKILVTDPTACCVDWRLLAPVLPPYGEDDRDPAAVIAYVDGELVVRDPGGESTGPQEEADSGDLAANNRLVIYELPTNWSRYEELEARVEIGVGTFRDVAALVDGDREPANFSGLPVLARGRSHLKELGINCLELLPVADSFVDREWGYATSNYFAPDYDLGFPRYHLSPTANADLAELVRLCHRQGIRFFIDVVMAFATRYSYQNINFYDLHVQAGVGDPAEYDQGRKRQAFGGDLFRYNGFVTSYDPVSGSRYSLSPARQLMFTCIARWINDFHVDGIRIDSVENIANWDFVRDFSRFSRQTWRERFQDSTRPPQEVDSRFLVVGEELAVPTALVTQGRLDGLWNEHFKRLVRCAILGETDDQSVDFAAMVRRLIDCRLLGFTDLAQAVNYVTSHDVEGFRNERLYNFLVNNGVYDTEPRIKLAFVCLLTAVGIPMIFAGEEFADEHDLTVLHPAKQVDPVNFDRSRQPWRRRIVEYVGRLIRLRTSHDALAGNDTRFLHADLTEGRRIAVWQRGGEYGVEPVVVVANFSDYCTPDPWHTGAEYVVPNWPATPFGGVWREVTQDRIVPPEWVGREPLFPWEAKVYVLE